MEDAGNDWLQEFSLKGFHIRSGLFQWRGLFAKRKSPSNQKFEGKRPDPTESQATDGHGAK
jgi:hypothetical protein